MTNPTTLSFKERLALAAKDPFCVICTLLVILTALLGFVPFLPLYMLLYSYESLMRGKAEGYIRSLNTTYEDEG